MAKLSDAAFHVHITWDTEPTEEAKALIRAEVLAALKEAFEGAFWFSELVSALVASELERERHELANAMRMQSSTRGREI